nr:unnamed protein product [Callosobruchus analis]
MKELILAKNHLHALFAAKILNRESI